MATTVAATAAVGSPPLIGIGRVMHARMRPAVHSFSYATYFLLLPMRSLRRDPSPHLRRNRFGLIVFADRDHGDGRADCLDWLESLLEAEGIVDVDGEVWLHCYPRVLGHTFKPVSFWYCHRADDSLAAVVVEVNNTFGERHCYLLHGDGLAFGREATATKVFHVSPFCRIAGRYRFRFMRTGLRLPGKEPRRGSEQDARANANDARAHVNDVRANANAVRANANDARAHVNDARAHKNDARVVARIEHDDEEGLLIRTAVSGRLEPLSTGVVWRAFFGMPLMTMGVVVRIHWQALRLAFKRVPFFRKPASPEHFLTR